MSQNKRSKREKALTMLEGQLVVGTKPERVEQVVNGKVRLRTMALRVPMTDNDKANKEKAIHQVKKKLHLV